MSFNIHDPIALNNHLLNQQIGQFYKEQAKKEKNKVLIMNFAEDLPDPEFFKAFKDFIVNHYDK